MGIPGPTPLHLETIGAVAATTRLWRSEGRSYLTVIAKATFTIRHGTTMAVIDAEPIVSADELTGAAPLASVRRASECAPFLPAADVLLSGHAFAPRGRTVQSESVRLAVFRDNRSLVDKTLHVYGDFAGAVRRPFESMPLVYERAHGGRSFAMNPVGVGFPEGAGVPNIVSPKSPKLAAGFGPINDRWSPRSELIDEVLRPRIFAEIADVPRGLSFAHYMAAPEDQRVEGYLRGDEWIVLDGMHPDFPRVQSRLPGARAEARVIGALPGMDAPFVPLALVADMLSIDADRMLCSLVWRGILPLQTEASLHAVRLLVGIDSPSAPIEWPRIVAPAPAAKAPETRTAGETQALSPEQMDALARLAPTPFASPAPAAEVAPKAKEAGGTMALPDDFVAGLGGLPFESKATAPPRLADPPVSPIPGAPWSAGPTAEVPAAGAVTVALNSAASALLDVRMPSEPAIEPAPAAPAPLPRSLELRALVIERMRVGQSLDGLDLTEADLSGLDFTGAVLSRVILTRANFRSAKLSRAKLRGAELAGADFTSADLTGVTVAGANLRAAIFADAKLDDADLQRVNAEGADLRRASLRRVDLRQAKLVGATMDGAVSPDAMLLAADLSNARCIGVDWSAASLREVRLRGANLERAKLERADLRDADLEGARIDAARFDGAKLRGINVRDVVGRASGLPGAAGEKT